VFSRRTVQMVCVGIPIACFVLPLLFKAQGWVYAADVAVMTVVVTSILVFANISTTTTLIMIGGRVAGILVGVLISFLVSFFCFPHSGSSKAVERHRLSLEALAEFGSLSWECLPGALLSPPASELAGGSKAASPGAKGLERLESFGTWIESVNIDLNSLYSFKQRPPVPGTPGSGSSVSKASSNAGSDQPQEGPEDPAYWMRTQSQRVLNFIWEAKAARDIAEHEALLEVWGYHFYFPVWPWTASPADLQALKDLQELGDATAEVARLLWNLSTAMTHAFSQDTILRIARVLPPELMPSLKAAAVDALAVIADLCPTSSFDAQRDPAPAHEAVEWLDDLAGLVLEITMFERHKISSTSGKRRPRSGGGAEPQTGAEGGGSGAGSPSLRRPSWAQRRRSVDSDPASPTTTLGARMPSLRLIGALSRQDSLVRADSALSGGDSLESLPEERSWRKHHPDEAAGASAAHAAEEAEAPEDSGASASRRGGGFGSLRREDPKLQAASKRDLLSRLGGYDFSQTIHNIFPDTPTGFIDSVRWMSFVYELNYFSNALFVLLTCLTKAARSMPAVRRREAREHRRRRQLSRDRAAAPAGKQPAGGTAATEATQQPGSDPTPVAVDCEKGK